MGTPRPTPTDSLIEGILRYALPQENHNKSVGVGLTPAHVETQYTMSHSVGTSSCRRKEIEPTTELIPKGNSIEIKLAATIGDLAAQIGTAREVLSRALKTLESLGLIKVDGDKIFITDTQALRERAM